MPSAPDRANKAVRDVERFRARYGPWAVVTGASSGIGREVAVTLAASGVHVVLVARRSEVLGGLATALSSRYGIQTRVVATDLATTAGIRAVETAAADLDVGLLVTAAGYGTAGKFGGDDMVAETGMLDLNCRAVLLGAAHFGRRFAARGRGGIVMFGSIVGYQGTPNSAHYAATKAYVQTLAEGLHLELRPRGVDVLASAPGPVASGFAARAGMTMSRTVHPRDVARPTLNALGRRTTVTPGGLSKLLSWSLATLPRNARSRVMGSIMKSMSAPTIGDQKRSR